MLLLHHNHQGIGWDDTASLKDLMIHHRRLGSIVRMGLEAEGDSSRGGEAQGREEAQGNLVEKDWNKTVGNEIDN